MGNAPPPYGSRYGSGSDADDGWGPSTSIHASGSGSRPRNASGPSSPDPQWDPRPPLPDRPGSSGGAGRSGYSDRPGAATPAGARLPKDLDPRRASAHGPGLTSWAALVVLLIIAGIGATFDSLAGTGIRGGFNIAIIVASIVAILLVRRSGMFPIVIAPPIVYSAASAAMLYVRSDGLNDHKALYDAAANWLVYGFPAIAGATAAVLIIAGIRLLARR